MTDTTSAMKKTASPKPKGRFARALDSDLTASFFRSRVVVVAGLVALLMVLAAFLAPILAPSNPYDLNGVNLLDASTPPPEMLTKAPGSSLRKYSSAVLSLFSPVLA